MPPSWRSGKPSSAAAKTRNEEEEILSGPLQGFRIVDIAPAMMGAYATQNLVDLGADIGAAAGVFPEVQPPQFF